MAERKIGDRTFKTEPLLAKESMRLLARLVRVGGAAWDRFKDTLESEATARQGKQGKSGDGIGEQAKILLAYGQLVIDIVRENDTEEVVSLVEEIVTKAMIKRPSGAYDPIEIDVDFQGRLSEIYQVAAFVLQEEYSDFFGASGLTGGRKTMAA